MDIHILMERLQNSVAFPALVGLGMTAAGTLMAMLFLRGAKRLVHQFAQRTTTQWDDILYVVLDNTKVAVVAIWVLNLVVQGMTTDPRVLTLVKVLTVFATTAQAIIWVLKGLHAWRDNKIRVILERDPSAQAPISLLSAVAGTVTVIILVMMGLSNLGVDIAALIAGLGIGGVAVALAAQNILGDLFASFSILFDKPFRIGDTIQVGTDNGTVENIGLKTTRVKSQTGEQLIFSNKDLLESRIRNFKRMHERRVVHKLNVSFETPAAKLKEIPGWVREILGRQNKIRFEYCNLTEIGQYAYTFETVFWVLDPDYRLYLNIQESYFHDLLEKLRAEKVELGLPTQNFRLEERESRLEIQNGKTAENREIRMN
ncbi:MAG: mechanosensitive ion channel [Bdellovibrionaceae bacterium]|nr:mechanosensitive ion channel [Pseudobdellovibrionaceae bacterium]